MSSQAKPIGSIRSTGNAQAGAEAHHRADIAGDFGLEERNPHAIGGMRFKVRGQSERLLEWVAKEVTDSIADFVDAVNRGDQARAIAHFSDDVTIIEDLAPFRWDGPNAGPEWMLAMWENAQRNNVSAIMMKISPPMRIEIEGGAAYAVVPGLLTYEGRRTCAPFRRIADLFAQGERRAVADQRANLERARKPARPFAPQVPQSGLGKAWPRRYQARQPLRGHQRRFRLCPVGAQQVSVLRVSMATLEEINAARSGGR